MKIFAPNALIAAVEKISQAHPLIVEQQINMRPDLLEKLIRRIDQKAPEELESLAKTLTRRQIQSLCMYLPTNVYKADLHKISQVISFKLDPACMVILFRQWQKFPLSHETLSLLGKHDKKEYRPDSFPIKIGLLQKWATASQPIMAVMRTICDLGRGDNFIQKLLSMGFSADSSLAHLCHLKYLCNATSPQFLAEGDQTIAQVLRQQSNQDQIVVLMRILACGITNRQLLTKLPRTYEAAYAIWRVPNRNVIQDNNLFSAYLWWYNYFQLVKSLGGDRRRIEFWKQYLDHCQCSRVTAHQMLIMRFGNRVVTEFEIQGPVYIYSSTYFDQFVTAQMNAHNTLMLKSWMFNHSEYLSRETHTSNWEIKQYAQLRHHNVI